MAGRPHLWSLSKTYEYEPLPSPTSIRLVRVLPKSKDHAEPTVAGVEIIHCALETVDLNDGPSYDALSYTWGSPFSPDPESPEDIERARAYDVMHKWPITINGSPKWITRNLYEALMQLREHSYDESIQTMPEPSLEFDEETLEEGLQFNKTPLIEAAEMGASWWVEKLLENGANVEAQDQFGETALHYAAENGHLECVKLLVRAGSSLELKDRTNRTPLECCEQRRRRSFQEVAKLLKAPNPVESANPIKVLPDTIHPSQLWIDAICINQDDLSERSSQVAIMNKIYKSANSSVVWLGVEDDSIRYAKDALRHFMRQRGFFNVSVIDFPDVYPVSKIGRRVLQDLERLLSRAWFTRVWVIQEVRLAKEVQVMCGRRLLPWAGFHQHAYAQMDLGMGGSLLHNFGSVVYRYSDSRRDRYFDLRILTSAQQEFSLSSLLSTSGQFRATDPRDHIFAILSLFETRCIRESVPIDYERSARDLFAKVAYDLLNCEGIFHDENDFLEGLSFLSGPNRSKHDRLDLPSWVPDFTNCSLRNSDRIFRRAFKAATSLPRFIRELPHLGQIGLRGLKFDEVEVSNFRATQPASCARFFPNNGEGRDPTTLSTLPLDRSYPSGHTLAQALWCTFMAGTKGSTEHNHEEAEKKYRLYCCTDEVYIRVPGMLKIGDMMEWHEMPAKTHGRIIYRTRLGYLGLGRLEIEPGDEVWLFAGARTPFIVRRLDPELGENVFQFKGETYVHGIMNGEAANGRENDLVELQLA